MLHYLFIFAGVLVGMSLLMVTSPILKGITTLIWGSGGFMGSPSTAIVHSGRVTPKNGMPIEIDDVNGITAALVFLDDGFDADVTLMYDTALTWPGMAQTVILTLPVWGPDNSGNTGGTGTAGGTAPYKCFVASVPSIDLERKKEATISYKLLYRPNCPAP